MLNALRKGAGGWLAKILFALLVISFAAWGVGDWTGGFRREKLAEVGGQEITAAEFERAYQNQLNMASNQNNSPANPAISVISWAKRMARTRTGCPSAAEED